MIHILIYRQEMMNISEYIHMINYLRSHMMMKTAYLKLCIKCLKKFFSLIVNIYSSDTIEYNSIYNGDNVFF